MCSTNCHHQQGVSDVIRGHMTMSCCLCLVCTTYGCCAISGITRTQANSAPSASDCGNTLHECGFCGYGEVDKESIQN